MIITLGVQQMSTVEQFTDSESLASLGLSTPLTDLELDPRHAV